MSHSYSPHDALSQPPSAFPWPNPSQSALPDNGNATDISVREILDKYQDDPELLKLILTAKGEEDKKRTAGDMLLVERARIQQRQLDLEIMRTIYHDGPGGSMNRYPNGLAPLQQQVIARITGNPPVGQASHPHDSRYHSSSHSNRHHVQNPVSPAGYYPHSAHPLCPPERPFFPTSTSSSTAAGRSSPPPRGNSYVPTYRGPAEANNKRTRSSMDGDKLSHDKVMEALKAKLQRDGQNKRVRTLAKPTPGDEKETQTTRMASPKSAKPILPPIDTSVGGIRGALSANPSTLQRPNESYRRLPPFSATVAAAEAESGQSSRVSPADHVLLTDRRVKSLSPPPSKMLLPKTNPEETKVAITEP